MTQIPRTLRTPEDLSAYGLIPPEARDAIQPVAARYAIALTPVLAALIDPNNPNDPIARQFVPSAEELKTTPEERGDPIGDHRHSPLPGLIHRYDDRVLLKLVNVCPVYCRFCFRREMVGPGEGTMSADAFENAAAYIEAHSGIWEVILSGGDPFALSAKRAAEVTERLSAIAHVKVLRWHTRIPVADPARVTREFIAAIKAKDAASYVVLHANHPRELTDAALDACARIIDAGIPMLSQSVLLKGVNDTLETLETLMRAFVAARIKPYYLHHADLAPGTAHFRTTIQEGQALIEALRARASGLAQPAYVLDIPGGYSKARLDPGDLDGARVRDALGAWHDYPPKDEP